MTSVRIGKDFPGLRLDSRIKECAVSYYRADSGDRYMVMPGRHSRMNRRIFSLANSMIRYHTEMQGSDAIAILYFH